MSPKISVVMSCYNSDSTIAASIESILNQTYSDFEFIIWNDGSTDHSEEIIKSYNDSRIRYFYHENTGLGMALRLACEYAKGEYIARMDSDDISFEKRFEKEVSFLDSHPDAVLVSSGVRYINDDGDLLNTSFPYTDYRVIKRKLLMGVSLISHPSSMFRREAYIAAGGYHALKKSQDCLLFARMMKYGKLVNLEEPLLYYRISENSISTQTDGNAYTPVITSLRCKMIHDENVCDEDIEIYNHLVNLARRSNHNNISSTNAMRQRRHGYEKLYKSICPIFG